MTSIACNKWASQPTDKCWTILISSSILTPLIRMAGPCPPKRLGPTGEVFPLRENDVLTVNMKGDEGNEIYAIVASGTAEIYTAGVKKV